MLHWLKIHLHDKLLAGLFAAVPLLVVAGAASSLERGSEQLAAYLHIPFHFPGIGFLVALLLVYVLGLIATSFFGKVAFRLADRLLCSLPGIETIYRAWRDVAFVSPEEGGMFRQVVLVGSPNTVGMQLGFTSGHSLPGDPNTLCVFLPGIPNLLNGRLVIVARSAVVQLTMPVEDAVKFLLSSGNYLPEGLNGARAAGPAANGQAAPPIQTGIPGTTPS
jgi:uncharacterized membrane protein